MIPLQRMFRCPFHCDCIWAAILSDTVRFCNDISLSRHFLIGLMVVLFLDAKENGETVKNRFLNRKWKSMACDNMNISCIWSDIFCNEVLQLADILFCSARVQRFTSTSRRSISQYMELATSLRLLALEQMGPFWLAESFEPTRSKLLLTVFSSLGFPANMPLSHLMH